MTVFGPHCSHDECSWIGCDAATPPEPEIVYTCKSVAECPYCGPASPDWPRLSAEWVAWCVGWRGTAGSAELGAMGGIPPNVLAMAELVEAHR